MDYKKKYLKYKDKYIKLRKLFGGDDSYKTVIYLVAVNNEMSQHFELVNHPNELLYNPFANKLLYENSYIQGFEKKNLFDINNQAKELYDDAKLRNTFINTSLVNLCDKLGALYICTKEINEEWNKLAQDIGLNIALFNGDGTALRSLDKDNDKFIRGINILLGCSTKDLVKTLNENENKNGKYFIGIDNFKHNYGNSFYMCPQSFKIDIKDFINKYETKYANEYPIIKIIKIFFEQFITRECKMLTLEKIKEKLISLKPKIDSKKTFSGKEHYFNSDYQIDCFKIDEKFENYIKNKIKIIEDEEAEEKSREKLKQDRKKDEQDWLNYKRNLLKINPNESYEKDITQDYKLYFNETDLKKIFDVDDLELELDKANNHLIINNEKFKIYLINNIDNKRLEQKYFKFIKNGDIYDYYNYNNISVEEDGNYPEEPDEIIYD